MVDGGRRWRRGGRGGGRGWRGGKPTKTHQEKPRWWLSLTRPVKLKVSATTLTHAVKLDSSCDFKVSEGFLGHSLHRVSETRMPKELLNHTLVFGMPKWS